MDEEPILTSQNSPALPDEQEESDSFQKPEQVFDITPDLNIAPVSDDDLASAPVPPPAAPKPAAPDVPKYVPPAPAAPVMPPKPPLPAEPKTQMPTAPVPSQASAPIPPPAPIPTTIKAATPLAAAPIATAAPKVVSTPVIPPIPARPPLSPPIPPKETPSSPYNSDLKSIRTFEGDIAEAMSHKKVSTASMVIAETVKKEGIEKIATTKKEPTHTGRNLTFLALSLVLLGGGAYGAYYLYSKSPVAPVISPTNVVVTNQGSGLVPADSRATIAIDGQLAPAILAKIRAEIAKPQSEGTIKEIIPVSIKNGVQTRISAPVMLQMMDVPAPDMVSRSLDANWMLGVYSSTSGNKSVFVLTTNNFFQNAFAGMLAWEGIMSDDLKQYLYSGNAAGIANAPAPAIVQLSTSTSLAATSTAATSTSTTTIKSTESIRPAFTIRGQFKDRIIANRDVREFVTNNGDMLFLYSFIDSGKMVIAGDEAALSEIINRLEKQSFIR